MDTLQAIKILGIPEKDTYNSDIVKKVYKNKAKLCHPDTPNGNEETFKKLNSAYQHLTGPVKRTIRAYKASDYAQDPSKFSKEDYIKASMEDFMKDFMKDTKELHHKETIKYITFLIRILCCSLLTVDITFINALVLKIIVGVFLILTFFVARNIAKLIYIK